MRVTLPKMKSCLSLDKEDEENISECLLCERLNKKNKLLIPEPTARSAVRRGLLIPLGYLHPGKCEHSEVQSHPPLCNGRNTAEKRLRMHQIMKISRGI